MCIDFSVWYIIPNEVFLNSLMAGDNKKFTHIRPYIPVTRFTVF